MHEMELWAIPLTTQPPLLECDTDLVKKALSTLLDPYAENSLPSETIQLERALNHYIKICNEAFLASERIRVFLLFSLLAFFIASFILLTALPISVVSIIFIAVCAFLITSANIFDLLQAMGDKQETASTILKDHCSNYARELTLRKLTTQPSTNKTFEAKLFPPISSACLFTPKKSLSEKSADADNENLNDPNNSPEGDKEFVETSIESISSQSSRIL